MPTLVHDGATIAYTDTGPPGAVADAPTIVFGHGLLFSGWMFRSQIEALRDAYRCVAIDWRGQGSSPRARGGYDMDSLADDAVELIGKTGTAPVHWVGLSMGGFVGMRIAARRPDLVRSLVLLDTSADREPLRSTVEDLLLALIYRVAGIAPVRRQVEKVMFGPELRSSPDGRATIDEWIATLSSSERAGIAWAVTAVVTRKAVSGELGRISAPTLVATGEHDKPTPPARGRRIAQAIPGARFELVRGAGHSSTIEQPDAVTALISDFLAEH